MRDAADLRRKATECRRLSEAIANKDNPAVAKLVARAEEFEAKAAAVENAAPRGTNFNSVKQRKPLRRRKPLLRHKPLRG